MEKVKQTRILECRETIHKVWTLIIGSLWCPFSFECASLSFSSWSTSYWSLLHSWPSWSLDNQGEGKDVKYPFLWGNRAEMKALGCRGCLGSVCEHSWGNGPIQHESLAHPSLLPYSAVPWSAPVQDLPPGFLHLYRALAWFWQSPWASTSPPAQVSFI